METKTKALPDNLLINVAGDLCKLNPKGVWIAIRLRYRFTHREIKTVSDLKATLRAGETTWPGGYPLYFITNDGAALSFESVRKEFRQVVYSIRNQMTDGWRVCYCEVNYEDANLYCDHSGKRIESAYKEDEALNAAANRGHPEAFAERATRDAEREKHGPESNA